MGTQLGSLRFPTLDDVWQHFLHCEQAIRFWHRAIRDGTGTHNWQPFLSHAELSSRIDDLINEVSEQTILALMASAEAELLTDYWRRVSTRGKDPLSKSIRKSRKGKKKSEAVRPRLKEDILAQWEEVYPGSKKTLQDFRVLLKVRNWLAHGRWWVLHAPEPKSALEVKFRLDSILGALPGLRWSSIP